MGPQAVKPGSSEYVLVMILPRLKTLNPALSDDPTDELWLAQIRSTLAINDILLTALLDFEFTKEQIAKIITAWWSQPNDLLRGNHPSILQCAELIEFATLFARLEVQRWTENPSRIPAAS